MKSGVLFKLLLVGCFIGLLASCSNRSKYTEIDSVLKINPEVLDMSSLFDHIKSIRIIPLETKPDLIIGKICTVVATEDRFFIFDLLFSKSVFIYDNNGSWINTICSIGKGPGEYANPVQLAFDPYNRELVINDPSTKKILRFDLEGNFTSELKLELAPFSVDFVDSETYVFKIRDNDRKLVLVTADHQGKNIKHVLTEKLEFEKHIFKHFHNYGESLFYIEYLNDTIYRVNRDTALPYRYIDFLDLKITKADQMQLLNRSKADGKTSSLSRSKAGEIKMYLESEKFIQMSCKYKGASSRIWINKVNNQQFVIQKKSSPGELSPLLQLHTSNMTSDDSGRFVGSISTDTYLALLSNDIFKENLVKGTIKIENSGLPGQTDVNLESNPVLAVFEMK